MVQFPCPTCSRALFAGEADAGSKIVCPQCNQQVLVPSAVPRASASQPRVDETVIPPLSLEELYRPPSATLEPAEPRESPRPPPRREPDRDEPRPRARRRRDDYDDEEDDRYLRRRRKRPRDDEDAPAQQPDGAGIAGLVLSCLGGCFLLLWPLTWSMSFFAGLPLSLAGLITSLCGRESSVRTLGIVFGAIGLGVAVLLHLSFAAVFPRRWWW